jgi:hypothetical protein
MSEIVMTNQASPGAMGANLSALFFNLSGQPCYVGNDGITHILLEDPGTYANLSVTANLALAEANTAVAGNATLNGLTGRAVAAIGQTLLVVTNNRVAANSHVFVMPSANDTTGRVTAVEPFAGNFRVSLVAPTANMSLDFVVFNPA